MPPQARVTKEHILDAALELVRAEGHEALTVRRLAAATGCSTQPVLYQFGSIGEIVKETYRRADEYHTAWLTEGLEEEEDPLLALGLRYIRFGAEEKGLFRFLFQSGVFSGKSPEELTDGPEAARLAGIVSAASGLGAKEAEAMFRVLFIAVHGYASLLANNAMHWESGAAAELLTALYEGLMKKGSEGL